ncbi:cytochrome P450 [Aspergillus clavatus NRRL 1]|uniref:Benzoate 4-monooxygenase cytochrome P450 n=1 Tax=Aspergillus clavatus (strain ATCC 1007 / CBS 513.65 / DSM 816 / NCTC 3887 / NRRL 1 / QM 1276 / 107) TaxID=344612 RepID=A1CD18_ASPCL|nr:benzoate 4-monooxygenase cytochrome P450 [Aspergillus clavatus NRRL 1]EAW12425.1 benzoate 4-monooxygenase cytochrome P450 [Aspergillus clavatus NRRL 1]
MSASWGYEPTSWLDIFTVVFVLVTPTFFCLSSSKQERHANGTELQILVYVSTQSLYNIYFHPLAGFPGPLVARASLVCFLHSSMSPCSVFTRFRQAWRIYHSMGGRFHRAIDEQHRRYGPVFRVSPNELSFASVASWKDIYCHRATGQLPLIKSKFYDIYGAGFGSLCIGSERDPDKHTRMKKSLSPAFSLRSLGDQEAILSQCVDRFVSRMGEPELNAGGLNMTKWYEMVAFDILGELSFGESFHSIEDGKPHFWSSLVKDHLYFITVADNLRHFPVVALIAKLLSPFLNGIRKKHTGYTRDKAARRIGSSSARKDFMANLIGKLESNEMDREELTAHASTLVIAGGETVATFLAATTFYLLRNDAAYQNLKAEIRGQFNTYAEITSARAQALPYLQAVISEGLRIYPPGSQGFPRVSPGASIDGIWVPAGAEVYTSAWTVTHNEANFHDPHTFKPERWIDPDCADIKEASQPFSLGTQACLGRNVAYMEINLILARLIWMYDMETVNKSMDWESESSLHVMWSKPDLKVHFRQARP